MPVTKHNIKSHYQIGLLFLFCLITIVNLYPVCIEVLAQESNSRESSSTALKSEPKSTLDTDNKRIFESEEVSEQKLQTHPFVKDQKNCNKCHDLRISAGKNVSFIVFAENSAAIQTVNCMKCHPQHFGDHPVLVKASIPVPKDLPLSERNEITCMTCHNTHFIRFSDRPWSPRSNKTIIFDFVKRKKEYKTFFLRRNNSKKEFCIACHAGVRHQRGY
ncbi:multiheme c-type cytochrome [Candidatus Latescibacterota bacterium]